MTSLGACALNHAIEQTKRHSLLQYGVKLCEDQRRQGLRLFAVGNHVTSKLTNHPQHPTANYGPTQVFGLWLDLLQLDLQVRRDETDTFWGIEQQRDCRD